MLLKFCLISVGILLALYFGEYLMELLWLWWTLFALTAIYFIAKCLREE